MADEVVSLCRDDTGQVTLPLTPADPVEAVRFTLNPLGKALAEPTRTLAEGAPKGDRPEEGTAVFTR